MRPIRVHTQAYVPCGQLHFAGDPDFEEFGVDTAEAKHLVIICCTHRVEEVQQIVNLMELDPDGCPEGKEWQRFMTLFMKVPVD